MMGPGSSASESSVLALLEVVSDPAKYKDRLTDMVAQNEALKVRENNVAVREVIVAERETAVSVAEAQLSEKITATESEINARATALVQRETLLASDLSKLATDQQAVASQTAQNKKRTDALDDRDADLSLREATTRSLQNKINADMAEIERKKAVLAQL